jgi:hypothetical protein
MKKIIAFVIVMMLISGLTACSYTADTRDDETAAAVDANTNAASDVKKHKIGVLVYSITDEEVMAFREYLESYIMSCFEDVQFVYSDSISSEEEALEFIRTVCENGAEGIMSFDSYDLKTEVDLCAEYGTYYMRASGTVSDEQFAEVEDNTYFLGTVGPGAEIEYQAGADMAQHFTDEKQGDVYFVLSGGSAVGNEMHRLRTIAILDTLQKNYEVSFELSSEELAATEEEITVEAGNLKISIFPGYLSNNAVMEAAKEAYAENDYNAVLSVLPVREMSTEISKSGAKLGIIDCYSESNLQLFNSGVLDYVAGKYSSLIGPSFAAMYNAVTGFASDFRDNGKAFRITQGFWSSDSLEDYTEKYTFTRSLEINAYNFEDLYSVCRIYHEDADFEALKTLAEAYDFDSVQARRMR